MIAIDATMTDATIASEITTEAVATTALAMTTAPAMMIAPAMMTVAMATVSDLEIQDAI